MIENDRRQAALAAEADSTLVGSALAAIRRRYVWNRHDLARWLDLSLDQLDSLSLEPLIGLPMTAGSCEALARRYGANARRLAAALVTPPASMAQACKER
jgi:hypothetical protein